MPNIEEVLLHAIAQEGDRYVFGVEVALTDTDPDVFDCSELVQWACAQAGVSPAMPDGSWYQVQHCRNNGTLISVDEAINTRGALLFKFSGGDPFEDARPANAHVAISLGNGYTVEARGSKWGVGSWKSIGRGWTHAGLMPGVSYDKIEVPWVIPNAIEPMWALGSLNIISAVSDAPCESGGVWLLDASGAIYGLGGAPYHGGCNGQDFFRGRTASRLAVRFSYRGVEMTAAELAAGKQYVVIATSGERYAFPL